MVEGVLKFDLSDPHEREEFEVAVHGKDLWLTLRELDEWLRQEIRRTTDCDVKGLPKREVQAMGVSALALQRVREHVGEIMERRGVNLEMMS